MDRLATEIFAANVAADLTGESIDKMLEAIASDSPVGSEWAELIELIIEIVMTVIENCPQRSSFITNTEEPRPFMQAWFRVFVVRKIMPKRSQFSPREVAAAIVNRSVTAADTEREQIWEEVIAPDFSVV